jgi:hypothetical protein
VVVFCILELLTPFFAPNLAAHFRGFFERIFLGTMLMWIAAISAYVVMRESRPHAPTNLPDSPLLSA